MSNFKTPLVVSPLPDGKHWRLHTKFTYASSKWTSWNGRPAIFTVPSGFVTDFASVPWPFWSFIRPWGRWGKAAIVHDYLYQIQADGCGRWFADDIFLEAMTVLGVTPWRRWLMHRAVRWFGWLAWRKKR
ncbi:hypothetical protein LCGC14_2430320 [marine sediment metagenome]|uniref:DUF1353 domain-containing protein n=1 Tax=marine sediment metagenome TaxID=412755 RepID=A0A0F9DZ59_9ZZZZ